MKVLAEGDVTVALNVTANKFSKSAEEKLNAAGGSATVVAFSKRAASGEGPVASAAGEATPAPEANSGAKGVLDSDPLQGGSTAVDADPEA